MKGWRAKINKRTLEVLGVWFWYFGWISWSKDLSYV